MDWLRTDFAPDFFGSGASDLTGSGASSAGLSGLDLAVKAPKVPAAEEEKADPTTTDLAPDALGAASAKGSSPSLIVPMPPSSLLCFAKSAPRFEAAEEFMALGAIQDLESPGRITFFL